MQCTYKLNFEPLSSQLGSRPKLGGAVGVEIFTKMCKKTKALLKNEGKIVIQEKIFACGEQLL